MPRINLAADGDLSQRLAEEAKKQNKTLYAVTNEAIEIYLKLLRENKSAEQAITKIWIFNILENISFVPVPETLLDKLLQSGFKCAKEDVTKFWYEQGLVVGEIAKEYAPDLASLDKLAKQLADYLPLDFFEINVDQNGEAVEVVMSGTGYSLEAANCTAEGIKGFLKAYGFQVQDSVISNGFVKLKALRA
jgi:hypothetical protein